MSKGFSNDETHEIEAFPAGEGADQRMRREADEGYALTASSVRKHPVHFTIAYNMPRQIFNNVCRGFLFYERIRLIPSE